LWPSPANGGLQSPPLLLPLLLHYSFLSVGESRERGMNYRERESGNEWRAGCGCWFRLPTKWATRQTCGAKGIHKVAPKSVAWV
jgi:hypothetical protein